MGTCSPYRLPLKPNWKNRTKLSINVFNEEKCVYSYKASITREVKYKIRLRIHTLYKPSQTRIPITTIPMSFHISMHQNRWTFHLAHQVPNSACGAHGVIRHRPLCFMRWWKLRRIAGKTRLGGLDPWFWALLSIQKVGRSKILGDLECLVGKYFVIRSPAIQYIKTLIVVLHIAQSFWCSSMVVKWVVTITWWL